MNITRKHDIHQVFVVAVLPPLLMAT